MNRVIMSDISSVIAPRLASAFTSATAGGTGDNTSVVGATIDRSALGMPLCAEIGILFSATLAATKTLSISALKVEDSADGSNWADYAPPVAITAPGVVATGPTGGGTVTGQTTVGVNLSGARRYVRVTHTPDLSATGTDTATTVAIAVFGGFTPVPAPV